MFRLAVFVCILSTGCSTEGPKEANETAQSPPAQFLGAVDPPPDTSVDPTLANLGSTLDPFHGDFDAIVERRMLRVLVTPNRTNFFLDRGTQRGITADALREFEKALNQELKLGRRRLHVVAIPVPRDRIFVYLDEGRGDMAAANLTVLPEREGIVDFSIPIMKNVTEVVVTGPGAPLIGSLGALSGERVFVRRSSSYYNSLTNLNVELAGKGLSPVEIVPVSEHLETEDILEMTNAGVTPITIADLHLAVFWDQIFEDIIVHDSLTVREGGAIAWAVRKDATGLMDPTNRFITDNRRGTLLGNMLLKRYLKSTHYVTNVLAEAERKRFQEMVDLFRRYGEQYELDWLLVAAQAYQESGLDQSRRSRVGAIGVMQLMPSTARDPAVGIPDIENLESNIHAGTKYMRYLADTYFNDPGLDPENQQLMALAAYNAGPTRLRRLRRKAASEGYDPNLWFRNVEIVVGDQVGREPLQYVSNIYKYYLAYRLLLEGTEARDRDKRAGP